MTHYVCLECGIEYKHPTDTNLKTMYGFCSKGCHEKYEKRYTIQGSVSDAHPTGLNGPSEISGS